MKCFIEVACCDRDGSILRNYMNKAKKKYYNCEEGTKYGFKDYVSTEFETMDELKEFIDKIEQPIIIYSKINHLEITIYDYYVE